MNIDHYLIYHFAEQVVQWLYRQSILVLLIFAIVYLTLSLLRPQRKELHFALWAWIFIRFLLPPDFSLPFSLVNMLHWHSGLPMVEFDNASDSVVWNDDSTVMENRLATIGSRVQLEVVLAGLWLIGFALQGTIFIMRRRRWRRIAVSAQVCSDEEWMRLIAKWSRLFRIKRSVTLKMSTSITTPFTLGTLNPVIVMPYMENTKLSPYDESFIAHEMAHVKRFDDAWILVQNMVTIFYFFHPVLWFANRRTYTARECICDNMVMATGAVSRKNYGRSLLFSFKSNDEMARVMPAFESRPSTARARIENLMKGDQMKTSYAVKVIIICCAFFILPLAVNSKDSSPQPVAPAETGSQQSMAAQFILPLSHGSYKITSAYGPRLHPITHQEYFHRGIDLSAQKGTPVVAVAAGVVQIAVTREMLRTSDEKTKANGLYVEIQHDQGSMTRYTQMDTLMVSVGQRVEQGETIGQVGSSGLSTGPHLHFEIWNNGAHVNPEDFIAF